MLGMHLARSAGVSLLHVVQVLALQPICLHSGPLVILCTSVIKSFPAVSAKKGFGGLAPGPSLSDGRQW